MQLEELWPQLFHEQLSHQIQGREIQTITTDSRKVQPNSLFVAVQGYHLNGADFISQAVAAGASAVVTDRRELLKSPVLGRTCLLFHPNPHQLLRDIVPRFYGFPSQKIKVIGVTGTNGKTTITYLLESLFKYSRQSSAVVGTINYRFNGKERPSLNTTPGFLENQQLLDQMVLEGIQYCVMEVSSHGLDQGRVDEIAFKTGIFTNLTGDHLDYHKTLENYFLAKSKLFTGLSQQSTAVINVDDPYGQRLFNMTRSHILTYALREKADIMARDIKLNRIGIEFSALTPQGLIPIRSRLIGRHNVYNILAVVGVGLREHLSLDQIQGSIEAMPSVPGRLERVPMTKDFSVFIDYAHTHDALENVLQTLRQLTTGRLILVFGCGGDRDKIKRPKMAKIASQAADFSFVTSDNPRSEEPEAIIQEILPGFERENFKIVVDRKEAIEQALRMARKDDIILLAGKGHETCQILGDKAVPFDERKIVQESIRC